MGRIRNIPGSEPSELGDAFKDLGEVLTEMQDDNGAEEGAWRKGIKHAPTYPDSYGRLTDKLSIAKIVR